MVKIGMGYESLHIVELLKCSMPISTFVCNKPTFLAFYIVMSTVRVYVRVE